MKVWELSRCTFLVFLFPFLSFLVGSFGCVEFLFFFWPYPNANRIIDNSQTLRFVHLSTCTPLSSKLSDSSEGTDVTWNAIWPLISRDGVPFSSSSF